ncbi:MAG: SGNH/GDSL hydrolase family protein [Gemmatimonadota bacterium]
MAPVPRPIARILILAAFALAPAACAEDRSGLARDPFAPEADVSFARYVALGNSITSGVQSEGINDSTQSLAYPVLLAGVFGAPDFPIPALARPGCTPPLERLVPPAYVGGDPAACLGLVPGVIGPFQNLAVPGYESADLFVRPATGPGDSRALQDFFLPPGLSAVEAMTALQPTFVTLWIGNNDVLGAALAGVPDSVTPLATFAANLRDVLASIAATEAGAAVANVPDVTAIPALIDAPRMSGLADTLQALGVTISVVNCDDKAGWFVSILAVNPALEGGAVGIDCNATDPFGVDSILTASEVDTLQVFVAAYNDSIAAAVADHGFALVDVHDLFTRAAAVFGPSELRIRVVPVPFADFGDFFSLDGVHPSSFAQRVLANAFIDAINSAYAPAVLLTRVPE